MRHNSKAIIVIVAAAAAAPQLGCVLDATDDTETVPFELSAGNEADRAALALRWAPIHYQDVDSTGSHALGGASDFITRFDYDGDLNARNNWDNLGNAAFPRSAHGYFSVAETSTHWFIIYMFFHPRDWVDVLFGCEHENDAEGLLLDGRPRRVDVRGAEVGGHGRRLRLLVLPGARARPGPANRESVDGTLQMAAFAGDAHPVTAQQAKGHGLRARPHYDIIGDGVVYFPSLGTAEVPSSPERSQTCCTS